MSDINVRSSTQKIYVDPVSVSVSVINAGPMGPAGPPGGTVGLNEELVEAIEALDLIDDMSNADVLENLPAVIKDLARQCAIVARVTNGP